MVDEAHFATEYSDTSYDVIGCVPIRNCLKGIAIDDLKILDAQLTLFVDVVNYPVGEFGNRF